MEAASALDRGTPMANKDEKLVPQSSESCTFITENSGESLPRYLQNSVAGVNWHVLHDIETARKGACDWDYIKGEVV